MDSLVSTEWLARELGTVVLDASMHLPDADRDPEAEFCAGHITGARFLDLDTLIEADAPVAHTLPDTAGFAARMAALGVGASDRIVVYDDSAIRSAARAWFVLRLFGATQVAILDGGLGKWKAEGRPLDSGALCLAGSGFAASPDRSRLHDKANMFANLETRAVQVIDARGAARFAGTAAEPRPGIAPGHIPGSRNLPYTSLFAPDGTYKPEAELRAMFVSAGIALDRPIVTTCGSGVTACALLFALNRLGVKDAALYDGSWAEWGADPSTPKETGV
jgi:thiosulfate/3-mercaptopyruvate sulfurtransferase